MPEHTSILTALLKSIFVGFGIVIPILSLIRTSNLDTLKLKDLFVLTAVQALRVGGILYFITFLVQTYLDWGYVKLYGGQWIYYCFSPVMYLLLSQLFWIRKLYIKKMALITFGLFLLILPSQLFLLMIKRFSAGSVTTGGALTNNYLNLIVEFVLNIVVFIFIIFTIILAGGKFKKIRQ